MDDLCSPDQPLAQNLRHRDQKKEAPIFIREVRVFIQNNCYEKEKKIHQIAIIPEGISNLTNPNTIYLPLEIVGTILTNKWSGIELRVVDWEKTFPDGMANKRLVRATYPGNPEKYIGCTFFSEDDRYGYFSDRIMGIKNGRDGFSIYEGSDYFINFLNQK